MTVATEAYRQRVEHSQRDALILSHLTLVRHVLGKLTIHFPTGIDIENLEAAGVMGLVDAANKFDATKGIKFKTYAYIRIRGAVLDEIRRNCPLPQHVMERVNTIRKMHAANSEELSVDDLARETGWNRKEVVDSLFAMRMMRTLSLESTADAGLYHTDRPEAKAELSERKSLLTKGITALDERERIAVTLYYLEDLRLKEIGQVLHLSESRVSRLLSGALGKLREYILVKEDQVA